MKFFGSFATLISGRCLMHGATERLIQAYFLGELPEDEAFRLEVEIAMNSELSEYARSVEIDLVDDFVDGRLPEAAADRFRSHYLVTIARVNRCRLSFDLARLRAGLDGNGDSLNDSNLQWMDSSSHGRQKFVSFLVGI